MKTTEATMLDIDKLLTGDWEQCQQLLIYCYGGNADINDNIKAIDGNHLIDLLCRELIDVEQSLTQYIETQLEPIETLDSHSVAILKFTDQLFDNYISNCKLHPLLGNQLKLLRASAATCLLNQQLPWLQVNGVVRVLELLFHNTIGWQPELGRAAERSLSQLQSILSDPSSNSNNPIQHIDSLQQFFDKQNQRIEKLEKRLYDSEVGLLHATHASQLSARTLNQQMAGKKLPATISTFLQGPWRESMRLIIINQGNDSEDWHRILLLTETLIWSFQPFKDDSEETRQHVYQSISELSEQLREITIGLHHSSQIDDELQQIENQHVKILMGTELEYQPFQLIDNTDPLVNTQMSISNSLIKKASSYEEGQWFIAHNDKEKRIKLCSKIDQAQQLLFSNYLGIKTAQYNYEEFAYLLSSRIIVPVKMRDTFKATGEKMIHSLLQRFNEKKQKAATQEAERLAAVQKQEVLRAAAREKALREATAAADAQKAALKKSQIENDEQRQRLTSEKQQQDALSQLDQVKVGGVIIFYDNDSGEHCKLAAVIQSTGEYIFVNRDGIKQHTLTKQQLAEKLIDESAKIFDIGSNFDSTLEQVVNNLRQRKNN